MGKRVINNVEYIMNAYTTYYVENMDMKVLRQLAYDRIHNDLEKNYTDEYLLEAIKDYGYPELLKEVTYDEIP